METITTVSIIVALIGFASFIWGAVRINLAFKSNHWDSTQATIITLEVTSRDGKEFGKQRMYVKYEYTVKGTHYNGSMINIMGNDNMPYSHANNILEKYQPYPHEKSKAVVFFNPKNPSQSLLDTGFKFGLLLIPISGLLVGILGILMLVV